MCNKKIFFENKLNAPIGAVNLLSFAGPCSKYQHPTTTYTTPKGELFLVCDTCYEKMISKSMRFDEMMNNDKLVVAELPKLDHILKRMCEFTLFFSKSKEKISYR